MMTLLPYLALSPAIGLVLIVVYAAIINWRSVLPVMIRIAVGAAIAQSFYWGIHQLYP